MSISRIIIRSGGKKIIAGVTALLLLSVMAASAQTPDLTAALRELSQRTGQNITTPDQAKALCDSAQFFSDCAAVGKAHNLYKSTAIKQVDAVLEGLRGKITDDLKACADAACIADVAGRIAQSITASNPDVARSLDLTPSKVAEKKNLISAAQDAGVDVSRCSAMDPDTAPVELLRSCAKLSQDKRVQGSLSGDAKQAAAATGKTADLQAALTRGDYQCGDNTINGCGNFCLNPATGTADIPAVCRQIAQKFFGVDGVRQLESAYQKTKAAENFYKQQTENSTFTTADGTTLTDPSQMSAYLQSQAQAGNVDALGKGLDFMAAHGLISGDDKAFALQMAQKVKDSGGSADFDQCSKDPSGCRNFVPDDAKSSLDASSQVRGILQNAMGIDPSQCQNSGSDPSLGEKCSAGARSALPALESLAKNSPQAQEIVARIKNNLVQSDRFSQDKQKLQQGLEQHSGPGGCQNETECHGYCSDAAHSAECIAFGAKNNMQGFQGSDAVQKFQAVHTLLQNQNANSQFPDTAGNNQQPFGQNGNGSFNQNNDRQSGQNQSGNFGQGNERGFNPGQFGGANGNRATSVGGPSQECLSAIQSGDFAQAKTSCAQSNQPQPPSATRQPSQNSFYQPSGDTNRPQNSQQQDQQNFPSDSNSGTMNPGGMNRPTVNQPDRPVNFSGHGGAMPPSGSGDMSQPQNNTPWNSGSMRESPSMQNQNMPQQKNMMPSSGSMNSMPPNGSQSFPPPSGTMTAPSSGGRMQPGAMPPNHGQFPPQGGAPSPSGGMMMPSGGGMMPPPPAGTGGTPSMPSGTGGSPPPSGSSQPPPPPPPSSLNPASNDSFGSIIKGFQPLLNLLPQQK